jgi:phenylalanyl-tRNA synthetase beta chain
VRIVVSWLRELCPTDLPAEDLADLLTSKGAEVEGILRPWERLEGVVAARVLEVRDHPNSDTLCLARVSTGTAEREVVVGVRNMSPGDIVPLAGPGSSVPGLPEPLASRTIRGVESEGMLCSPLELGVAPTHEGIMILPGGMTPGDDVARALGLIDAVLDIEVTPNRPDFLSVLGIAREVAAATGSPLVPPDASPPEEDEKAEGVASIEIADRERCPRYLARIVRGIRHVASPLAVQARLTASGMRPISAAVDATNYAMLEIGQPLHPFDLSLLRGPGIIVRRAAEGERLVTLDGIERIFVSDDLLIADAERAIAVAGVMGGALAEVSEATTDILLESASFERRGIQRTRRRLGLSTEASTRFERGVDPEAVPGAADRACSLMAEWCDARVLAGSIEAGEAPPRRRVAVRPSRASLLLGSPVGPAEADEVFDRLGMRHETSRDEVIVEVPGYRVDIETEVDLIEEIVRVRGYDGVTSTLPPVRQTGGMPEEYAFCDRLRDAMRRAGLRETSSLSFASADDLELTGDRDAVPVANPLDAEEGFLRASLLPGVLRAVARNQAHLARSIALFEIGTVFRLTDTGVEEQRRVAFALAGSSDPGWSGAHRSFDFFDASGVIEAVTADLGAHSETGEPVGGAFHPGRTASVDVGGRPAGVVGEVHPMVAGRLGLSGRIAVAELKVSALSGAGGSFSFREVPRFPPVRRDLAFVVAADVPYRRLRDVIVEAGGELLERCELFDTFSGGPIPEGRKSLAFALVIRATDRTLTDEEADEVVGAIVTRAARVVGAELRAG